MTIRYHLIFIPLLILVTLSVYYKSFANSFAYDDYALVVDNPSVKKLNFASLISYFADRNTASSDGELSKDNWRPFVTASFAIDYKLWGLNPRLYHAENAALHIINAVLVYTAGLLMLSASFTAFLAALIFAIHPVQTEAVAWVSGRSNLLFLLFFLLAFIFHVKERKSRGSVLNYNLSLILFAFSLFSKEMAITLPIILIIYDLHFREKNNLKDGMTYYLPFFLIGSAYLVTRFAVLGTIAQQETWWGNSILANILVTLRAIAGYVRLLILPVNLGIEYLAGLPKYLFDKSALTAIAILAGILFFWYKFRKDRIISFYTAWFFVTLLPVCNIVPFKAIMAERFLYLPSIAFAALSAVLLFTLKVRCKGAAAKVVLTLAASALFLFYASATISRNGSWKDEITLYAREVSRLPANPRSHYNLGFAYFKAAQCAGAKEAANSYYALAAREFDETVRLKPEYYLLYFAYANLADICNQTGRYGEAIENFKKAKAIKEGRDEYNSLAVSYFEKGEYDDALIACRKAISSNPADGKAYITLGNIYFVNNERAKAKRAWLKAAATRNTDQKLMQEIAEAVR